MVSAVGNRRGRVHDVWLVTPAPVVRTIRRDIVVVVVGSANQASFTLSGVDTVVVIAGDDKDLTKPRKVLEVIVDKARVLVEGVNIVTKHTKPNAKNTQGGIVKQEAPIQISKVMVVDGKGNATRVGRRMEDGKLVRYSKKSGEVIK